MVLRERWTTVSQYQEEIFLKGIYDTSSGFVDDTSFGNGVPFAGVNTHPQYSNLNDGICHGQVVLNFLSGTVSPETPDNFFRTNDSPRYGQQSLCVPQPATYAGCLAKDKVK